MTETAEVVERIRSRLAADLAVDESLPGGWLHIDRPLPFLVVARVGPAEGDPLGEVAEPQASHLMVPAIGDSVTSTVISAVAEQLADRFGSFLIVDLWTADEEAAETSAPPTFRVFEECDDHPSAASLALAKALEEVEAFGVSPEVEVIRWLGRAPLLSNDEIRRLGALLLGLEIPRTILDPQTGQAYPLLLRDLRRDLSRAIQRAAYEFADVQTTYHVEDYRALGRHGVIESAREVDEQLVAIGSAFEYLLGITPVNADEAWAAFRGAGCEHNPSFHYRHLLFDPDLLKRQLFDIRIEDLEDPTLAALFRAKRAELDRQISLLEVRGSAEFVSVSVEVYGGVDASLLEMAHEVTNRVRQRGEFGSGPSVDAVVFAKRAQAEIDHYRAAYPELRAKVQVRDDVPGVLVANGDLLVGSHYRLAEPRVDALLQHEVGTHVVTWVNGSAQPLRQLQIGLPGYEETQEGLGVLAEYFVGGLTPARLGLLAARVLAVDAMLRGASFVETFRLIRDTELFSGESAFGIVMRVYRSGGLTKDAMYLRGLSALLQHLAQGGSLEPLLLGKLPLQDVPVVEELRWRQVLRPPVLRPRWIDHPQTASRLAAARQGLSVIDLVEDLRS